MTENDLTPNLLIVDDIPANLFTLQDTLEDLDINIMEASSGNEALNLMSQHDFALVLLDVQMPEMSGYEVAALMRRSKHTKHTPIIFITANSREKINQLKGYDVGAVDYISKPFDKNILISKVKIFIDLYRQKIKIEELRVAAEAGSKLKGDFLANMSHELRTPMNGVLGMNRLLLETNLNAEQRGLAETVHKSGNTLLDLLNDILDFSKIEAGELTLEPLSFNLHKMLEEVTDLLEIKARGKNIELLTQFDPDALHYVIGDSGRIRQIIMNLVGNAIKFTDKGHVLINVDTSDNDGKTLILKVKIQDTGIGIPDDKLDYIFNKFSQAEESTTRKFGGTGLGLAISKKLVEMMEGEIGVKSILGEGSTFWFNISFPIGKEEKLIQKKYVPKHDLTNKRILIVDDYEINQQILGSYVKSWNMDYDTALSAEEAFDRMLKASAENKPYDFALLDYQLPADSGLALAERIKSTDELKNTLLIMVTSAGKIAKESELEEKGLMGFLVKPVYPQQLHDLLMIIWDIKINNKPNKLVTRYTLEEVARARKQKSSLIVHEEFEELKILVVDDVPVNVILMKQILTKLGCSVDTALNGIEAVNMTETIDYNIVFMDCHMPEMDGFEATSVIREKESDSHLHIIALTADAMQGDKEKCLAGGMDDYMNKPVTPEKTVEMLDNYLNKSV